MPQLVIRLSTAMALDFQSRRPGNKDTAEIVRLVQEAGGEISAMHPGVVDSELQGYFSADLPDAETATRLSERILQIRGVEMSYVKPADALPGM